MRKKQLPRMLCWKVGEADDGQQAGEAIQLQFAAYNAFAKPKVEAKVLAGRFPRQGQRQSCS